MGFWLFLLMCIYFMLPAYFANMAPVILKRHFNWLAVPIDNGMIFRGRPLLGKNKTWRGLIFGTIFGIMVAFFQYRLALGGIELVDYSNWFALGCLLGFGAIFGDLAESFIKRRLDRKPGNRFFPWDQLDFVLGALLLTGFILDYSIRYKLILVVIVISPILHIIVNHLAYFTGIRNEKW